jgi:hypothetical protein
MREKPITSGMGKQARPIRQFAKNKTAKNALDAAT